MKTSDLKDNKSQIFYLTYPYTINIEREMSDEPNILYNLSGMGYYPSMIDKGLVNAKITVESNANMIEEPALEEIGKLVLLLAEKEKEKKELEYEMCELKKEHEYEKQELNDYIEWILSHCNSILKNKLSKEFYNLYLVLKDIEEDGKYCD